MSLSYREQLLLARYVKAYRKKEYAPARFSSKGKPRKAKVK